MEQDDTPPTEPSGSLDPPRRQPPTAVATATPEPAPREEPRAAVRRRGLEGAISRALDVVDALADGIAGALRIR
jgi:hypothetical protein